MSASLAAFFADGPFQPPFEGGADAAVVLPSECRRARPLVLPAANAEAVPSVALCSDPAASSPFRTLLRDAALAPLLSLHPYQAETGREGEREWLFGCRELLRERLSYGSLGSPEAWRGGVIEQAGDLLRAWAQERHHGAADGIVLVATEAEIASGIVSNEVVPPVPLGPLLSFSPARLYLLTAGAVEEEIALGSGAVSVLVEAVHRVGSLAGVVGLDPRLLGVGAGLNPARLGFDLALFDFSFLMEGEGEWHLPAFDRRLAAFLPPDADEAWTGRPGLLLRAEAALRLMGEAGLAAAATAAAIRADYAARLLGNLNVACGRNLLEVLVPGRGALRFSGLETAEEVEARVGELVS